MTFDNPGEILMFLKYLLKLKPGLLKQCDNIFRIILEPKFKDTPYY